MDTQDAPQIIEHINKGTTFSPFVTKWLPCSAKFVVLGQHAKATGALQVWELNKGEPTLVTEAEKPHGFKCATFGASSIEDRFLATGDYSGNLQLWDLERLDSPVYNVKAHNSIVNAMDGVGGLGSVGCGAPEIVTCSRDGAVRVWDPRTVDPVICLEPEDGDKRRDCWGVAFGNSYNDEERCVAAGYDNGDVKLFDLRTNSIRWETNIGNGIVSLEFDRRDIEMNKLAVTTLESKFRIYDLRTQHPKSGFTSLTEKAHKSTIWLARHLPQNRDIFMTCGGNGGLNIYKYQYPASRFQKDSEGNMQGVMGSVELLNSKIIGSQPIVSFDWSVDKEGLAVCACLDQTIRVFIVTKLNKY